jgi:sialic acid synthase SpsE
MVSNLQFSPETWEKLFQRTRRYSIDLFAFVYDAPSLELASRLGPDAYKLNSSDLSNPDLLRNIAGSGKPYTVGTGASSMEEISRSLDLLIKSGGKDLILMHGVQNFPTPLSSADIGRIELLRNCFDTLVGYADHTDADNPLSSWSDLLAIGAGACLLEKHIVMDRANGGVDYQAALEPKEFKTYVYNMRAFDGAMGSRKPQAFTESSHKYRKFQKKVATAILPIRKGEIFCRENIAYLRHPESGLSPFDMEQYLGQKASRDIEPYKAIEWLDVDGQ